MKEINTPTECQLFICVNEKERGESCGPKGAAELRKRLKDWAKKEGLHPRLKVTASRCLGHCEMGITAVLHPQNRWWVEITPADEEALKQEVLKNCGIAPINR